MTQFFLEAFQWHGVKRGRPSRFTPAISASKARILQLQRGNSGNGRTRAPCTPIASNSRGSAGPRQVKVRAETALAAFTTPSSGGWIMFGKYPS